MPRSWHQALKWARRLLRVRWSATLRCIVSRWAMYRRIHADRLSGALGASSNASRSVRGPATAQCPTTAWPLTFLLRTLAAGRGGNAALAAVFPAFLAALAGRLVAAGSPQA